MWLPVAGYWLLADGCISPATSDRNSLRAQTYHVRRGIDGADAVVVHLEMGRRGAQPRDERIERGAIGQLHDEVIEADSAGRRRGNANARPRVETEMVMVVAGRDEQRAWTVALCKREAEDADVEAVR